MFHGKSLEGIISAKDFLRLPRLNFVAYGIRSYIQSNKLYINYKTIFFIFTSLNLLWTIIGEMIYFLTHAMDVFQMIYSVMCIGFLILGNIKIGYILLQMSVITELFEDFESEQPKNKELQENFQVKHYLDASNRVIFRQAFLFYFVISCFNIVPLCTALYYFIVDDEWNLDRPYNVWYPFDTYRRGMFEIIYVVTVWASITATIAFVCVDSTLACMVNVICMHFHQSTNLLHDLDPNKRIKMNETQNLVRFVRKQTKIFMCVI